MLQRSPDNDKNILAFQFQVDIEQHEGCITKNPEIRIPEKTNRENEERKVIHPSDFML